MEDSMRRGACAALLAAVVMVGMGWGATAQAQASAATRSRVSNSGQVYLLRGLIDVFSQGMDDLGEKLRRRGVSSITVMNHSAYETLAAEAIAKYRAGNHGPIIIGGHSLGADAAMEMAQLLNDAKVPVAMVVGFGPTLFLKVPANVARVVNYYQAHSAWNGTFSPGPGFRGSLLNINLDSAQDITHFNIEKNPRLHDETIARVMAIMGRPHKAPATPAAPTTSAGSPVAPSSSAAAPAAATAAKTN
jgi:pimeloyl-ACP methyl ester carboxylesterase